MSCVTLPPDTPGCINIPIMQGNSKRITLVITDSGGSPIDLSNYSLIKMIVKSAYPDGRSAFFDNDLEGNIEIEGQDNNHLVIDFNPDYTQYWTPGRLSYDILFIDNNEGLQQHWFKGIIDVTPTITRQQL